ncbi:unnamed protein product, partial [Medioppia subpectinata]
LNELHSPIIDGKDYLLDKHFMVELTITGSDCIVRTNYKRSVNLVPLSAQQELKRFKSQRLCECISLITIIFGLLLVTITPFLLIPIWVIPNPYSPLMRNVLCLSLLVSVMLLTLAALTGNIYWYYDQRRQKWKWFYHCGKGPEDHYWGATLLHDHKPQKPRAAKKVRTNAIGTDEQVFCDTII